MIDNGLDVAAKVFKDCLHRAVLNESEVRHACA
jgi:hypothetical protein